MQKKLLIDASHQEETRIVLLNNQQVEEFDFETINKKQIAGNIYLAKVTRLSHHSSRLFRLRWKSTWVFSFL